MELSDRNKKIILFSGITIFIIIVGLGIFGYAKVLNTDLFYEGIHIEDYDISLMTKEEALQFIKDEKEPTIEKGSMKLTHEDKEYDITLRELGFFYDYEDAIDQLYSIGREGNIFKRVKDIINARNKGVDLTLDSGYDEESIEKIVDDIAEDIDVEVQEANFNFNGGNIQITEGTTGKDVDREKLSGLISNNIYDLKDIEIPVNEEEPKRTKELLSRINGVIGEFSTSLGNSTADRVQNIRVSSRAISNRGVIMPGETVSFNETTGPRQRQFGYREANVIIDGEFTPDVGGGVCQTSTTLYNALLLADITIVERSPHSIPSTYVSFGQDAAVAYGHLDLKFRNDFDYPIYIDSGVSGGRVYFRIYGDRNARNYTIRIDSQTVETIAAKVKNISDSNLAKGKREVIQQGRNGYRANTYKSVIRNGKTVSRDLITKSYYKPREFIYRVGTKPVPASPPKPPKPKDDKKKDDSGDTGDADDKNDKDNKNGDDKKPEKPDNNEKKPKED
ncbi:MAG: hypothetical protein GX329_04120 [Tissierellia bacterium]|nr:hypothetical protein [Tissierellia bacterium]